MRDIYYGLPEFMREADMIYCDPPWDTNNINAFMTKAGLQANREFEGFCDVLFDEIAGLKVPVCYLEIGARKLSVFQAELRCIYPHVQTWEVTYYRKNRSYLVRGGFVPTTTDFTGIDDMYTPQIAMEAETCSCVADLCMGRGLTGLTAYKLGKRFVGTELNKRRLAVLIDNVAREGGQWIKEDGE